MDGRSTNLLKQVTWLALTLICLFVGTAAGSQPAQAQTNPSSPALVAAKPTVDTGITIYVAHWRDDVRRGYAWAVGNDTGKTLWSSSASPGRSQGLTPKGTFEVERVHERGFARRTDEPLPYFFRLGETSRGIHAYHSVPAYPASSGCIRVPLESAKALWDLTGPYRDEASDGGRTWSTKPDSITIVVLDTRRDALREQEAPAVTQALKR